MTKLEEIKDNEWECILRFINSQISMNKDIINAYRRYDFYDKDLEKFVGKSWAFIPEGKVFNKSKTEKVDYYLHKKKGNCFFCGDDTGCCHNRCGNATFDNLCYSSQLFGDFCVDTTLFCIEIGDYFC